MTHEHAELEDGRRPARALVPRVPGQEPVERASAWAVAAVLVSVAIFLYLIRSILLPFIVSGALAFVCAPLVDRLARASRAPRWASASIVCGAVLAVACVFITLAVPRLALELQGTIANLQPTLETVYQAGLDRGGFALLGHDTDAARLAAQSIEGARHALGRVDIVADVAFGGFSVILGLILTIVLYIYFMASGPAVAAGLLRLVPPKQRPFVAAIWAELDPVLYRYFAGLAIVVVYATTAAYAGLAFVLHLPNAGLLAVVTGLLEVVPIVGPAASAIISGLFALHAAGDAQAIFAYVVYVVVFRLSVDQVVSPLVLGRAGRVHPVVIIFSFLAGGTLFGIAGIILAIPVALAIKTALAVLYEEPLVDARSVGEGG